MPSSQVSRMYQFLIPIGNGYVFLDSLLKALTFDLPYTLNSRKRDAYTYISIYFIKGIFRNLNGNGLLIKRSSLQRRALINLCFLESFIGQKWSLYLLSHFLKFYNLSYNPCPSTCHVSLSVCLPVGHYVSLSSAII